MGEMLERCGFSIVVLCLAVACGGDDGDDGQGQPDGAPGADAPVQAQAGLVLDFRSATPVVTIDGQDASGQLTVARTGDFEGVFRDATGAWVTAPAGAPRIDHDEDGNVLGLLFEPTRTNYMTFSNDFGQWTPRANTTVTADAAMAPDGTMTATNLVMPQGGGTGLTAPDATVTAGTEVVFSMWARANGDPDLRLELSGVSGGINQDLVLTDEWVQYTLTGTVDGGDTVGMVINNINEGTLDCFIFGVQIEEGSTPSSYIPTSGAAQTRGADVVTLSDVSWGSDTAGTYLVSFRVGALPVGGDVTIVDAGNAIRGAFQNNITVFATADATVSGPMQPVWNVGDVRVGVASYGGGNVMYAEQGASAGMVVGEPAPIGAQLSLGGDGFTGHVRYVEYFDRATDEQGAAALYPRAQ